MSFDTIKPYLDLTRIHFFIVWPLLFCSGLFLSFNTYSGFSWSLIIKAALIALFGFEAGFILNDIVDAEYDKRDIELDLTRYWRPFGSRPLASEDISLGNARVLFIVFFVLASVLIITLPYPNSVYVFSIMVCCYCLEYFYQIKKRDQSFPFAQLIGRIDFSLFPVAGYLVNGHLDKYVLMYFLFFYPFAQVHLGINDIIDVNNDLVRGLRTVPILYGLQGTKLWIHGFSVLHIIAAAWFYNQLGGTMSSIFYVGGALLLVVNLLIKRGSSPSDWIKALPFFHLTLLVYMLSLIVYYFLK